jgi:quercetin dioxygenase-like cupin family protein
VTTAATTDTITVEGMEIRFLVEGKHSAGMLAVFEFGVPAGVKIAVAHSHDGYEETIVGLEGALSWTVEGEQTELAVGEALVIPRGAVHDFANRTGAHAKALAIATPGVIGPDFFQEVAVILDAAAGGPPDVDALVAVMLNHGLTPHPAPA